jgi:hypothetical protein
MATSTVAQLLTTTKPMREASAKLSSDRMARSTAIRQRLGVQSASAARISSDLSRLSK